MDKDKIMNVYKKMNKFLEEKNFRTKKIEKNKIFKYKEHEYEIKGDSYILDCDDDLYGKILYINSLVQLLWLRGEIKLNDVVDFKSGV